MLPLSVDDLEDEADRIYYMGRLASVNKRFFKGIPDPLLMVRFHFKHEYLPDIEEDLFEMSEDFPTHLYYYLLKSLFKTLNISIL